MYQLAEEVFVEQGSAEWLALRKNYITATDASIIMKANHWKTPYQLYNEKTSDIKPLYTNEAMQRGKDLEPIARDLFCLRTGHKMVPKVLVREWTMASLDGLSDDNEILEVKCPGAKDHATALAGNVPDHYYPQLQHQIYVVGAERAFYFSFDGLDGVIVEVKRDDKYIAEMLDQEKKFYECLMNRTPPEVEDDDYIYKDDLEWDLLAMRWKELSEKMEMIAEEQEHVRERLVKLCNGQNSKGSGIKLCSVQRKGNVEYSRIPELKNVDLEKYRKPSTTNWRITCH